MSRWMSENSKNHYGTPNVDEIHELVGRICCGLFAVLAVIFIVAMF